MATMIPARSAKRQRLLNAAAEKSARALADADKLGPATETLVIQLTNGADGTPTGPLFNLPASTGPKELEMIVNHLRKEMRDADKTKAADDDPHEDLPFAFHVSLGAMRKELEGGKEAEDEDEAAKKLAKDTDRLNIATSLADDILQVAAQRKLGWGAEEVIQVVFEPQAVFRVRPVRRCSSALSGHSAAILCSSFSPTATLLATGSGDNTARIWDLDSESPLHALVGHRGWVLCVEWEGRERRLATGDKEGDVWIWDAPDSSLGRTGRKAWGSKSSKQVAEEMAAQAAKEAEQKGEAPPAKVKLSVHEKRALRNTAPPGKALRGHSKWVTALAWEPIHLNASNPRLASSSKDGTVRIWDVGRQVCDYVLGGHTHSVNQVRWGGHGAIYTCSSDSTIRIWDAKDGRPLRTLRDHSHWINTLALSTDFVLRSGPFDHLGKVAGAKKAPETEDEATAQAQAAAKERFETTVTTSYPERMLTGSDDQTLFLWEGMTSLHAGADKPVTRLTGHQQTVNHVSFSPDGKMAASASFDKKVKLWDGRSGKFIATLTGHVGAVYRVAWSPDSRILASASKDGTLKLWDLKKFKILVDLPGHTDEVYTCDWAADKLASGGRDKQLRIWRN